eukprot:5694595-Prymnesium_polylepis.1
MSPMVAPPTGLIAKRKRRVTLCKRLSIRPVPSLDIPGQRPDEWLNGDCAIPLLLSFVLPEAI